MDAVFTDRARNPLRASAADARIVADISPAGTCVHANGSSVIDYFFICDDLASTLERVAIGFDSTIATHRPVQIVFPADAGQLYKLAVVPVQSLPSDPVYGPRPLPPGWSRAHALALKALRSAREDSRPSTIRHALPDACRAFAETVEIEVALFTG